MKQNKRLRKFAYVITSCFDGDDMPSSAWTKNRAWERFCYPALKRSAYEEKGSGYRVKRIIAELCPDHRWRVVKYGTKIGAVLA